MNNDDAGLTELAGAILDGTPVDWEAADSGVAPRDRRLVTHLRAVAAIAEAHRGDALETWGPLRLLERIGRGAFGDVYRAWDSRLDREVALKLLPADPSSSSRLATSIIEEGRLLARVRHPSVVTIHGAERIDERVGLWMEFVEAARCISSSSTMAGVHTAGGRVDRACALRRRCRCARRGAAPPRHQGAERDAGRRRPRGPDGLRIRPRSWRALGVDLAGTPLYLAPEVLAGASGPSVQSDIYSIGVLLLFLLTGSYPVTGWISARSARRTSAENGVR